MSDDARTDVPRFVHRLGVALQFVDAFTDEVVRTPLRVRLPALGAEALAAPHDATYRVLLATPPPPAAYDVEIESLDGAYAALEPLAVPLPRPASAPPPPVVRADYLVRAPLWPTVRTRLPAGETAVVGTLGFAAPPASRAGYKVVLHAASEPPPSVPYAGTDEHGDFLYRLGRFKASAPSSGMPVTTVGLTVRVFDPAGAAVPVVSPSPASLSLELGRVHVRTIAV